MTGARNDTRHDRTHGQQFKTRFLRTSAPTSIDGIEKYLGSGMIRGIGPIYAKKMVKAFGEKVLHNTTVNTEAAFDAAQAIARARSLPEAARLQADFMQQQLAVAGAQTKELFELSTKLARQTLESVNAAAAKSFDNARR